MGADERQDQASAEAGRLLAAATDPAGAPADAGTPRADTPHAGAPVTTAPPTAAPVTTARPSSHPAVRWWTWPIVVTALFLVLQPVIGSGWAMFPDSYRYAKQAEIVLGGYPSATLSSDVSLPFNR